MFDPNVDGVYWIDTGRGVEFWLYDGESWHDFDGTKFSREDFPKHWYIIGLAKKPEELRGFL